ncbi:thiol:disulfide interchange protein DsbA/DsbL [Herminiimonas fonticola]|uniref:Thiol:disulfide interchange protein n=1 Tax=Herminiimonas fonticola TaxID=303380 RepID=A0A4R6GFD5_9BURK|nr:thiol:disulfide interchange protein DsbA/DsbL [Herminiimonas fonticola]RBA24482.1 DSBA-like thioredoxin domain [Herminiimonas fonticola]TDN93599.1 thiol:disulfide interchange protein DsbA [Herminiimonas fonticola]
MRFIQHLLAVATLSLMAATAGASPTAPVNGTDYRTLEKAQQTDSGKKVEVTEFFWYSCSHCNAFEPSLEAWVKKNADKIVFKRVPVVFRDSFIPQQKLYYTIETLGLVDTMHARIFRAIHVERQTLDTEKQILDFIAKQPGVDIKKFTETYNSFGIQTKVSRAAQLQAAYKVDGVPMVAVDGRYVTSPSIIGAALGNRPESVLHEATLQVMDHLIAKSAK